MKDALGVEPRESRRVVGEKGSVEGEKGRVEGNRREERDERVKGVGPRGCEVQCALAR